MMNSPESVFETMNAMGSNGLPFLFLIDFACMKPMAVPLGEAAGHGFFYNVRGLKNIEPVPPATLPSLIFDKNPVEFNTYQRSFDMVMEGLRFGNSYLLNLTFPTQIKINRSLEEIFRLGNAPYRLLSEDRFVVFSPECFIRITGNTIRSFPMKGTIDAGLPDASGVLLSDRKEKAEHNTIVDLIRNDLSMVADNVRVERFRYLEEIRTNQKHLLQASSEIAGTLTSDWRSKIGTILRTLLPAGSVSGAPKASTVEIIRKAEPFQRGFYTGVFGIFDGQMLDSAVMIRYIEQKGKHTYYHSGGGITINSIAEAEYMEMTDKVYVPFI
ncbi:MAG: aminodeoxychorismate synthase component I [Bacteroidota bacterium]